MDTHAPRTPARLGPSLLAGLALIGLTASSHASPPAPFHSYAREIGFVDLGGSLAFEAELYGLDRRRDLLVTITAEAEVELACVNPAGNEVPSQTPDALRLELDGTESFSRREIRLGRLDVEVYTDELGATIPGAPDCPNRNWTERVEEVRFRGARIEARQPGRREIELVCEFTRPTSNGRVPDSRIRCYAL